jgi:cytochrome oxidase Cu insertion factor (SCO1/SenC/PrrC family)
MKYLLTGLILLLTAAFLAPAQEFTVGSTVSDFPLHRLDGAPTSFTALRGNVSVVIFISVQCPVSNAYNDRMAALYRDYTPKGVHFIFVNANRTEPAAAVEQHAAQHHFPFAVYKDDNNVAADKFGATVTPETYVIDATGKLRYHGSIDNSQNESRITGLRLRGALDAVLAGQNPPQAETRAFGCSIKRVSHT